MDAFEVSILAAASAVPEPARRRRSRQKIAERRLVRACTGGIQPWRFVVITDREKLDKIPDFHPYAGMIKQAPLAILVCGDTTSGQLRQILGAGLLRRYGKPVARGTPRGWLSLWCGVHPSPNGNRLSVSSFNLPGYRIATSALPSSAIPRRLSRIRNVTTNRKCIITSGNPSYPTALYGLKQSPHE